MCTRKSASTSEGAALTTSRQGEGACDAPSTWRNGLTEILTVELDMGTRLAKASSTAAVAIASSENWPSAASCDPRNGIASSSSQTRVRKSALPEEGRSLGVNVDSSFRPVQVRARARIWICRTGR